MLSPMRYKSFTWPHNPKVYGVEYERPCAVLLAPLRGWFVQELGPAARVMRGEGVFYGPEAYSSYRALEQVFRQGGPGLLVHPVWPAANAYFTSLKLEQEPLPDYVAYSFAFREGDSETGQELTDQDSQGQYRTVAQGETFWGIAAEEGLSCGTLTGLNPWLRSPNALKAGDRLRVR